MNRRQAIWHLSELAEHIKVVVNEVEAGDYDEDGDPSYQIALAHLMDHLNLAWHFSKMSDEQVNALTTDQLCKYWDAIPKFKIDHRLVDPWEEIIPKVLDSKPE
jgi:hypothetical protein